jgi:hypothetical protein
MSEMSPEMMPEMINPMARPKIMAPAASRMARIVARMFSVAFVVSCYDLRRSENKFAPLVGAMFGTYVAQRSLMYFPERLNTQAREAQEVALYGRR